MITKQSLIDRGLKLIPVKDIEITLDPEKTVGYDLTVDDYYTFATDDGVFLQDCMALYVPVTEQSYDDIAEKILITNNLLSPANGELVTEPNQDIVLGLYSLTKNNSGPKRKFTKTVLEDGVYKEKTVELSVGRFLFNQALPKDYPVILDTPITHRVLILLLNRIARKCTNDEIMMMLDSLKLLGFACSTLEGFSLSIKDLYNSKLIDISNDLTGDHKKDLEFLRTNEKVKDELHSMPFSTFIESGARGSWGQAQQLVLSRGYVTDHLNNIRPDLIRSSFLTGMTMKEYFQSCWGARKGLLDTALSAGDSGYLTRQLIYSTHFVELGEEEDCKTKDYLDIELEPLDPKNPDKNKKLIAGLYGRFCKIYDEKTGNWSEEINIDSISPDNLVGKKLKLRSPIYCKGLKICKRCYGNTYKKLNSEQIGIVATQCIGERLTQLVLRTFHFSGAAGTDRKSEGQDIISGMSVVKQYLHKPGSISEPEDPQKLIMSLFKLFSNYGTIYLVHLEVIVSAMLWKGESLWRTLDNRNKVKREWVSILKIPSLKSWLIGCAFSNLKSKLLDGLVRHRVDEETAITSLFRF